MKRPWLKHYDSGVPATMGCPDVPLDIFLRHTATMHPDHTATVFGARVGSRLLDAELTYYELDREVDHFAIGLQKMGIKKGDRVAIMLPNCPQFIIAAYAIWRIGGVVVCCNPLYVPREIEHLINDSGAETFIVMSKFYENVKSVRDSTCLKRVIVTNIKEYFSPLLRTLFTLTKEKKEGHRADISGDKNTYWFQKIIKKMHYSLLLLRTIFELTGKKNKHGFYIFRDENMNWLQRVIQNIYRDFLLSDPSAFNSDEVATLIYTSGTTGVPKGAQLTHQNLVSNAFALNAWAKSKEAEDVLIACMPFFHSYGLTVGMNTCVANALTMVLVPNPRDLKHLLGAIEKNKATFFPGVPAMFVGINNSPDTRNYNLRSLRFAASAAAPLAPEVQQEFESLTGCNMVEAYGLTETSPTATMQPIGNSRPHSIGIPIPDTDVKIVDMETGTKEMPVGEKGEIIIRGPQVMKGYWNMPEATAKVIRKGPDGQDGWLYSGDIGFMDEDGYFHIADRETDMIIVSGYNVYPTEVENILFEHPCIQEAAVIGVPHERSGETVKAFVVLKEGRGVTEDDIITFCRGQLAAYKIPRTIKFCDELPKNLIGKVLRRELRDGGDKGGNQNNPD